MNTSVNTPVEQSQLDEEITGRSPQTEVPKEAYTAYIAEEDGWWIGWVQGVRGVNCQEKTREALLHSLKVAIPEMLELNQEEFIDVPEPHFEAITIRL